MTLLGLLDLSAAFDTVDQDILLTRLQKSYGVRGTALAWISSFIQGRQQSVTLNGHQSTLIQLKYGVPQGSVLGPLLFILYTSEVISIAASLVISIAASLDVPSVRTRIGSQAFSVAGPQAWNSLPVEVRNAPMTRSVFKNRLKTFLFEQA